MSDKREEGFEAWFAREFPYLAEDKNVDQTQYFPGNVMWCAWQAVFKQRDAVIETLRGEIERAVRLIGEGHHTHAEARLKQALAEADKLMGRK